MKTKKLLQAISAETRLIRQLPTSTVALFRQAIEDHDTRIAAFITKLFDEQTSKKRQCVVWGDGTARFDERVERMNFGAPPKYMSPGEEEMFLIVTYVSATDLTLQVEAPFVIVGARVGNASVVLCDDAALRSVRIQGPISVGRKIVVFVRYPKEEES
jgi:hypothetical protein